MAFVAVAQRTTRKALRPMPEIDEIEAVEETDTAVALIYDTIVAPPLTLIDINGYDKPLRSRRETFFATNNSKRPIASIAFTINYYDTRQRQLHAASHRQDIEIPANQTRQISLRSWDAQQSFYYVRSTLPQRVQQATPYEVTITVDTIFINR